MLIGNRLRFAIEILAVQPSWEAAYPPEAAAWAGLGLWVSGKNLCAHVLEGETDVRGQLFVPLGPIANWFVTAFAGIAYEERVPWADPSPRLHDVVRRWGESFPPSGLDEDAWLDHREAFWGRHFLVAGAEGAWLPNLAFLRQDESVVLAWKATRFLGGPQAQFLHPDGEFSVPWDDVESVLERFVETVASIFEERRLCPYDWVAAAPPRLRACLREPSSSTTALYCARPVEGISELLGVGIAELPIALGDEALVEPAASPLCQVIRDLPPQPSAGIGAEVLATVEASRTASADLDTWFAARRAATDAARSSSSPEEAGKAAARVLRTLLGIELAPITSTGAVLAGFGVVQRESLLSVTHEQMLVAAAPGRSPATTILHTKQTAKHWGRRFEEVRALGHVLLDPLRRGALGAASTRWAQEARRRRSGAFAAELLLPEALLRTRSGGHLDSETTRQSFAQLMSEFGVGARTTAYQLYNNRLLTRPARDELIADFTTAP